MSGRVTTLCLLIIGAAALLGAQAASPGPGKGSKANPGGGQKGNPSATATSVPKGPPEPLPPITFGSALEGSVLAGAPTSTGVRLSAWFDAPASAILRWGTAPDRLDQSGSAKTVGTGATAFELTALPAGRELWYRIDRVGPDGATLKAGTPGRVVTARPRGTAFSFVVEADPHFDDASSGTVYSKIVAAMAALKPDFAIDLGDSSMVEKLATTPAEANNRFQLLRSWWNKLGPAMPILTVLGNHDGEYGWRARSAALPPADAAALRRSLFPAPITASDGFYRGPADTAYAFDWGDALFIVLDPYSWQTRKGSGDNWDCTLGKAQYDWLAATLAASDAAYRFVFIHNLVGGAGKDNRGGALAAGFWEWGGSNQAGVREFEARRPGWPLPIHDLLVKGKVDVVFHGHDHFYAREEKDGMTYLLVPQPALGLRQKAEELAAEYGYGGTVLSSPGFVRVSVASYAAAVELLGPDGGAALDRFTIQP